MFLLDPDRIEANVAGTGAAMCMPNSDLAYCANATQDVGNIFVGLYMTFFGILLGFQELLLLCTCQGLSMAMKKNFGFLYGVHGKSSFMVFMAILPSGLQGVPLRVPCGVTVGAWGIIHTLWYFRYPDHFVKHIKYNPATDD